MEIILCVNASAAANSDAVFVNITACFFSSVSDTEKRY